MWSRFARSPWQRVQDALFRPVDIAWLAAFRVLFSAVMCVSVLRFVTNGWVDEFFVKPSMHFKYWGFAWVAPLPGPQLHVFFWMLAGLALAMCVGVFFRLAAFLFALGFTYVQLIDVSTYLNHYYLASLLAFLLALSPAHRAYSLDAFLRRRSPQSEVPSLWLYLFRFQIGLVYTSAALAKAHGDWLLHAQPLSIWLSSQTGVPVLGALFSLEGAPIAMSWAGFLFDATAVWFLLSKRLRPYAFAVVIVFHLVTSRLFSIGMFPVIMVVSALVFFSPSWPRLLFARAARLLSRTSKKSEDPAGVALHGRVDARTLPHPAERPTPTSSRWRAAGIGIAALYALVQIVMPLRFLAYGGNLLWHEQGMRFSWRVMVREKNGSVTFLVRNKQTGRITQVTPRAYLTRLQERELSIPPDLILQLAHRIRDDFEKRDGAPMEVRVEALVSLNGRRSAYLIDPSVDLSSIRDGIGRAAWILPSPAESPPRIHPI